MHEAYAVSQPAKIGVQIECIAGYGELKNVL